MSFPAFPVPLDHETEGMTLLDYFAGQALAGILTDPDVKLGPAATPRDAPGWIALVAEEAYDFAAAMLVERERRSR